MSPLDHTSVGIRQHTSAYVSIRQQTSANVSIRQHPSAYLYTLLQGARVAPERQKTGDEGRIH